MTPVLPEPFRQHELALDVGIGVDQHLLLILDLEREVGHAQARVVHLVGERDRRELLRLEVVGAAHTALEHALEVVVHLLEVRGSPAIAAACAHTCTRSYWPPAWLSPASASYSGR